MSYLKIGKYYGENENNPTYQIKETLDSDYLDVSNVYHWFSLQELLGKDFLYYRTGALGHIVNNGGFAALSDIDKELASKYFCVSKTDRDTIHNDETQESNWFDFVVNSETCRLGRWNKAKSFASFRLSPTDSTDLAITTALLNEKYIKYGVETLSVDGSSGLYDWVNGTGDYSDGSGFSSKLYYTLELKNGIIDRLNGTI